MIYERLKESFLSKQDKIRELDEPGVISAILNAVAQEFETLYTSFDALIDRAFVDTAAGEDLDRIAALLGCTRKPGTKAQGVVRFYVNTPKDNSILIPAGTMVRTVIQPDGEARVYKTLADAVLQAGQTSVDVEIEAVEIGEKYNVPAGYVNVLVSKVGVDGVTNPDAITGGSDPESDEEFRARIPLYLDSLKRATADAIRSALLTIPGIQDAIIEDGTTPGTFIATIVGSGYDMTAVQEIVNEYKAAGVIPTIQEAPTVTVNVSLDLYVLDGYDSATVQQLVVDAVNDYLNNLKLGAPAQIAEIIAEVMKIEGVDNVKNVLLNGVADDVVVGPTDKIIPGTIGVNLP